MTTCEELLIIDSIYRLSQCTYTEAKHTAEDIYMKIVCTNNRENIQSCSIGTIPEQWFLTFAIRQIDYFRQYSSSWLSDLETMADNINHGDDLYSFISLLKESV